MRVSFWGVRGSVPVPGRHTWRYGGNTPCVEVRTGSQLLIFDAGTGIRELGRQLLAEFACPGLQAHLFLSHYHWDHIQGLPFFEPLYFAGNTIRIFGPRTQAEGALSFPGILEAIFRAPFFPVSADLLQADHPFQELDDPRSFTLGNVHVRTCRLNHPQGCFAYRVEQNGASLVYATDHEPGVPEFDDALRRLARDTDLLISDAQYRPEELGAQKAGWGHGSWKASVALARDAGVKNLILFHHEPLRSDQEVDNLLRRARQDFPHTWAAAEGMLVEVTRKGVYFSSSARRLSQRAPLHIPVTVETTAAGRRERDEAQLENISFQGAYLLSPRPYEFQQPVELDLILSANGNNSSRRAGPAEPTRSGASSSELRLRGYVLRTEPQTTNGGWVGVAVHFPGAAPPLDTSPPGSAPKSDAKS